MSIVLYLLNDLTIAENSCLPTVDFPVGSMFPQNRSLQDVMDQVNVTLPAEDVQALSRSTVNVKEVGGVCVQISCFLSEWQCMML